MVTLRSLVIFSLVFCFSSCKQKTTLTIQFDRVDNLLVGAKVYHKGFEIGEETRLGLFGTRILADVQVKDNIRIPVGSIFIIVTNFLEAPSIKVKYADQQQFLSSADTGMGRYEGKNLMDRLDRLVSDSSKQAGIRKALQKIGEGVSELVETARDSGNIDNQIIKEQK